MTTLAVATILISDIRFRMRACGEIATKCRKRA